MGNKCGTLERDTLGIVAKSGEFKEGRRAGCYCLPWGSSLVRVVSLKPRIIKFEFPATIEDGTCVLVCGRVEYKLSSDKEHLSCFMFYADHNNMVEMAVFGLIKQMFGNIANLDAALLANGLLEDSKIADANVFALQYGCRIRIIMLDEIKLDVEMYPDLLEKSEPRTERIGPLVRDVSANDSKISELVIENQRLTSEFNKIVEKTNEFQSRQSKFMNEVMERLDSTDTLACLFQ